jgi:hypothetical protein
MNGMKIVSSPATIVISPPNGWSATAGAAAASVGSA